MGTGKRKRKLTDTMQEVAADICNQIIMETWDGDPLDVRKFVESIIEQYNLQKDPFTELPCSCKEYAKNREEYDRQLMIERYGYYE